jgi:adenine phosphoribosyltransferase
MDLKSHIPVITNWPKTDVNFLDIGGILKDPQAFSYCVRRLVKSVANRDITSVVAVESRGFMFAGAVCALSSTPLYLARKAGKLPGECYSYTYQTEYSTDTIELQKNCDLGDRPLIIDDLLATGGTILALSNLIKQNFSPKMLSAAVVINLEFLQGQQLLEQHNIGLDYIVGYSE